MNVDSAHLDAQRVVVYSKDGCPYCVRAKELLTSKNIKYQVIDVTGKQEEREALHERTGSKTVPQIFIDDVFIGGCTELIKLNDDGELDRIMAYTKSQN